ncbi:hypothetical protein F2Q70_00014804 [Brassica cretica]|uniref:GTPase HflX N-terminal domain-containing protein n=1 Tax=Brassica cretica TaxID=69181 RepID=A0A8S9I5T8_BRACR|nr:hypothetical protein F2Q70_00014804 [Brassica cretica]
MSSFLFPPSSPIPKSHWRANSIPRPNRPITLSLLHGNSYSWRLSCKLSLDYFEESVEEDEIPQFLDFSAEEEEPDLEKETVSAPTTTLMQRKKKKGDEESLEDRFKLRNGKEVFEEKAYLVGVERKGGGECLFDIEESLEELEQLADTAGLMVVGSTYQKLASPNPRTYIGSGKVSEIKSAINALDVETVIFDDELSPG